MKETKKMSTGSKEDVTRATERARMDVMVELSSLSYLL